MLSKLYVPGEIHIKDSKNDTMEFEAYGNVKNIIDHALDVAMDGCYTKSIETHKKNGTMPSMLWSHDSYGMPVGAIKTLEEDSKGLLFGGVLSQTTMGKDLYVLAKDGAINQFSIGYIVNQERWNSEKSYNELVEIDVKEISWVNFPCNEESQLVDIKSTLANNSVPSIRELEKFLRGKGMSNREAKRIASCYNPERFSVPKVDADTVKGLSLFQ